MGGVLTQPFGTIDSYKLKIVKVYKLFIHLTFVYICSFESSHIHQSWGWDWNPKNPILGRGLDSEGKKVTCRQKRPKLWGNHERWTWQLVLCFLLLGKIIQFLLLFLKWVETSNQNMLIIPFGSHLRSVFYSLVVEQAAHELLETNTYDLQCREAKNIYSLQNIMPYMLI